MKYFSKPNTTPPFSWPPVPKLDWMPDPDEVETTCSLIADPLIQVRGEDVVPYAINPGDSSPPLTKAPPNIQFNELGLLKVLKTGVYVLVRLSAGAKLKINGRIPVRSWIDGRMSDNLEAPAHKPVWVVLFFFPIPREISLEVNGGNLETLPFTGSNERVFVLALGPTSRGGIPDFETVIPDIHDVNDPGIFTHGWKGYRGKTVGFRTERPGVILGLVPRSPVYGLKNHKLHAWKTYGSWLYPMGVALTGLQRCADAFCKKKYETYVRYHFDFVARYFDQARWEYSLSREHDLLFQLVRLSSLDDCGAMGSSMAEAYLRTHDDRYLPIMERVANYIHNVQKRMTDGTFCRRKGSRGGRGKGPVRIWADDVYHSAAFLVRMGAITGNNDYFDDAARQILLFSNKLFDTGKKLYVHCYYATEGERSPAFWGRADGWAFIAGIEVLEHLPPDHPLRERVLAQYLAHAEGRLAVQDRSGFWHQLLDRPDSYLETTSTAMAVYCFAHGIRKGWLVGETAERARIAALRGWYAITRWHIYSGGIIEGTCKGTDIRRNLDYYYRRPVVTNDLHGVGPVLMAGAEVVKLIKEIGLLL